MKAHFISKGKIEKFLANKFFDKIILSGGEPLAHIQFFDIFELCKKHSKDVVVYTNLLTHVSYNANVIDGIYIEAAININQDVDKVRILKRVNQGREAKRPEVSLSKNFFSPCTDACRHRVMKPNGDIVKSPCDKTNIIGSRDEF